MYWSILHRSIFLELLKVFLLALVGITGILVMAGIVVEASQQGLSLGQIFLVLPLLVPSTLPYTIPATTLFAVCLVYGRLAHDNEILAIKSAGINILQVVWPGAVLGLLMSTVTLALYVHLIPRTHYLLRSRFLEGKDVEDYMYALLKKDGQIRQPGLNYAVWVEQVQGRLLIKPTFKRMDEKGNYDVVAWAREADLKVDIDKKELQIHMRHGEVYTGQDGSRAFFEDRTWPVPLPKDIGGNRKSRPRALTCTELFERRHELADEQADLAAQIVKATGQLALPTAPFDLPEHIKNLKSIERHRRFEIDCVDAELHMRPAIAFGCLFFVLVGCPVGIWFCRSDYLSAFITCFLPIVVVYYPILLCSTNLAKDGQLPAILSLWLANGAMALVAPVLFWKLLKN